MCGNFSNSQWIYGVRDFVAPPTTFTFFFFTINVHGNTRYSKNGIPDQTDGIYTLLQTKMAKSIPYFRLEMLENGTYLYGSHMGVPPPPPPRAYMSQMQKTGCCQFVTKCLRGQNNSALHHAILFLGSFLCPVNLQECFILFSKIVWFHFYYMPRRTQEMVMESTDLGNVLFSGIFCVPLPMSIR